MLLSESVKSPNISQNIPNESQAINTTNSVGVTASSSTSQSSTTTTATTTPLKSRNQNRDRQQSDDKQENANSKGKNPPKPLEEFYKDLQQFHEKRGTPIMHMPKITGNEIDLHRLYCEVTERGGFQKVNNRDEWDEILPELGFKEKIVNGSAALKYIYRRVLEKYERLNYFGEDPDKVDALEAADMTEFIIGGGRGKGSRYPSSYGSSNSAIINSVAMTYNYRQHHVNMDRRRQFKLSTDLHKSSAYEKLMLSLLSPLPNEQDFAINACTLMANESKHTLKLNEYPKLLDALLAHTGVFSDYTMRKLFQHIYNGVRHHSLYGFWNDLLSDKPQILDLYTDEQALREASLIDDYDDGKPEMEGIWQDCKELDFLNLGTGLGTQDYVGQRVLQIISILRNLSFQEENFGVLAKNKTFLRFLVMSSNIRWSNVHIQALEITGNIAGELEIADPTIDDLSRSLMATICDGIEGPDRGVIINCLEILYKLCQKDTNEDYILKCLNMNFYNTVALFLSLNDVMLLLFTLEAIYALTSLGSKSCHSVMQVKGIIDQLVALITVEAQSYGPDGYIMMRVVETVPGNMLPIVAQNIANLQNMANLQKQASNNNQQMITQLKPQIILPNPITANEITETSSEHIQQQQTQQQIQLPQNYNQDDEQYALAWLGATFERTSSVESHIETQELYRMYLSHCQKSGKHSVVNHLQFPKLVRLIFTSTVGPASVKKSDGSELPGLHYVSIRLRAQPLPLQKTILSTSGQTSPIPKTSESPTFPRKTKKKAKQLVETTISPTQATLATSLSLEVGGTTISVSKNLPAQTDELIQEENIPANPNSQTPTENMEKPATPYSGQPVDTNCEEKMDIDEKELPTVESQSLPTQQISEAMQILDSNQSQQTNSAAPPNASTSLIKSLLANKVNQRQQKQKDIATSTNQATPLANIPITTTAQPIKVASTAITALVNNPLMQNTPVKVGQTTIKPLNPHPPNLEKKSQVSESTPPPLAPLSGANVAKDASGRPIILANQMLVDILDKKLVDPPIPAVIQKRKLEDQLGNNKRLTVESSSYSSKEEAQVTPSKNAANLYAEMAASILEDEDLEEFSTQNQQPSLLLEQPQTMQHTSLIIPAKVQAQPSAPPLQNVQRQLVFQSNQPQIKLTQTAATANQQLHNAVATIKTDQGLQTVPVILQQKPMEVQQPQTQIIQQMIQPAPQQQQTQYVLATNQQGQTYLVAQQTQPQPPAPPPQSTQTVLVTQTPQQQSTGQKTIIILQQQALPGQQQQIITTGPSCQGQKMIMTTSQGQQVLVTQRPQTPQQIFINPQTGTATHTQYVPVQTQSRQIIQTPNPPAQQHQAQPIQAGQISPSLLNQLNQIPATIKLHQPIAQQSQQTQPPQPATITRMGKTVSLVQSTPPTPTPPVPIPQLQQHQSIIQQHIISGPSEKRHVILSGAGTGGGGVRAIEIKETVITQAQQPPQQCQLNSQTIITTQQPQVTSTVKQTATPSLLHTQQQVQQQVQQQIRAVIEQQQHPSIIQQKISSLPVIQQHQQQTSSIQHQQQTPQSQLMVQTNVIASKPKMSQQQQTPTQAAKPTDPKQSLIQTKSLSQSQNTMATITASISSSSTQTNVGSVKKLSTMIKPSLPTVKLPSIISTGPPPLATVNTNVSVTSSIASTTLSSTVNADSLKDTIYKEEEFKTTQSNSNITSKSGNQTTLAATEQSTGILTTTCVSSNNATSITSSSAAPMQQNQTQATTQPLTQQTAVAQNSAQTQPSTIDAQWLYVCDWRYCPRKEFKSISDLKHHIYTSHVPDFLDPVSEIFCQWGAGNFLCDKIPRKRYSLMTHIIDRHLTIESLKAAAQRRIETGIHNIAPPKSPVTIVRNMELTQKGNNGSSTPPTSSSSSSNSQTAGTGLSALQAIKRHTADFLNSKDLMDENEGPVTKSIRLTASLILRNLVTYTSTAKRGIRRFEPHLANIALSNVESSGTIAHILYEMNG